MNDIAVIDSSVAIKLMIKEHGSEEALNLINKYALFVAPSVFTIEVDAVMTKKVRSRMLPYGTFERALEGFDRIPVHIIDYKDIRENTLFMSSTYMISSYDASFVVVAHSFELPFYTADKRLYNFITRDLSSLNINAFLIE
jgi:predicted nucleic acid-binding protein